MPDYEINTFAELCQRIIDSDGKGVENLVAVTSPGAFACTIKIEGDGYCGEIPGFLLQSLSEFQTQAFRAYAMAVYGKDDLRGLDKSKLWCSVQSRQGWECQDFCVWGGYSRGSPTRLPFVFEMQYARPDAIAGAKVEGPARSAGGSSLAPAIARREAAGALAREV